MTTKLTRITRTLPEGVKTQWSVTPDDSRWPIGFVRQDDEGVWYAYIDGKPLLANHATRAAAVEHLVNSHH